MSIPLLRSSWSGDDWPNSQTPYWIEWRYGTLTPNTILNEAFYWNREWVNGTGRFFPLAFIESRFFFSYFQNSFSYKLLQFVFSQVLICLLFFFVLRLSKNFKVTAIFSILLIISSQFRNDFDPHLGFSLLLPSLLIKIFIAEILFNGASNNRAFKRFLYSLIMAVVLFASYSTYEYAILISLFVIIPTLFDSQSSWSIRELSINIKKTKLPLFFYFLSTFSYIGYVFAYLRPKANDISGAYVLGVSWKSIPTFITNATAGIPLVNFANNDLKYLPNVFVNLLLICIVIFMLINQINSLNLGKKNKYRKKKVVNAKNVGSHLRSNWLTFLTIGSLFTLAPALMLSIQETWWNRVQFGHSYLGVYIQEIGFVFIMTSIYLFKERHKNAD